MSQRALHHPGPVEARERIALIDALRGFALFGILLVNVAGFKQPFQAFWLPLETDGRWFDLAAEVVVATLAEGKFYPLFSLLFGLGFAIQLERARAGGGAWRRRYARRLAALFVIGLVHAVFIWAGDILMVYAVLGVALMLFAGASPRTLVVWMVAIGVVWLLVVTTGFALLGAHDATWQPREWDEEAAAEAIRLEQQIAAARATYAAGSFADITAQRLEDLRFLMTDAPFLGSSVLFYFLLGLYIGKRRVFHAPAEHEQLFRRWVGAGVWIGAPLALVYAATQFATDPFSPGWIDVWAFVAFLGGGLALSLGYAGGIALLWQRPRGRAVLALLAPVGRMALTNYLLQSLAGTLIFYGYGLGLYGRVSASGGLAIAAGIYACQVPLSLWWLRRYRFGPAEWLWRSLTYGRLQPMRLV